MRRPLVIVVGLVAALGCEEETATEARGITVALCLTAKSEADARTAAAIVDELGKLAGRVPELTVLSGTALHDRLDADPGAAKTTATTLDGSARPRCGI